MFVLDESSVPASLFADFARSRQCFALMPDNSKMVIFDSHLLVRVKVPNPVLHVKRFDQFEFVFSTPIKMLPFSLSYSFRVLSHVSYFALLPSGSVFALVGVYLTHFVTAAITQ